MCTMQMLIHSTYYMYRTAAIFLSRITGTNTVAPLSSSGILGEQKRKEIRVEELKEWKQQISLA